MRLVRLHSVQLSSSSTRVRAPATLLHRQSKPNTADLETHHFVSRALIIETTVASVAPAACSHKPSAAICTRPATVEAVSVDTDLQSNQYTELTEDRRTMSSEVESAPESIRRHHHLANETVFDAELGIYLDWCALSVVVRFRLFRMFNRKVRC